MSVRHANIDEVDRPSAEEAETRAQLLEWWRLWESLPTVVRDRPVVDVLAEERQRD